jgi:hypothetical protein
MTEHSEAFKEWHAKRSASLAKSADELAAEYVKDGFSDSGATRRTALLEVFRAADGSGWDAWQAGREAALEEAATLLETGELRGTEQDIHKISALLIRIAKYIRSMK